MRLVKEEHYFSNSPSNYELSYQYDTNGRLVRKEEFYPVDLTIHPNVVYNRSVWSDTSFLKRDIIHYDTTGRIIEHYQYDNNEKFHSHLTYDYNTFNQITHIKVFNEYGKLISQYKNRFDVNGNPLQKIHIDINGDTLWSQNYKYTYYYD